MEVVQDTQAVTGCLTDPLGNGVLEIRVSCYCSQTRHSAAAAERSV